MSRTRRFLDGCRSTSNLRRAVITAIIVGPVLTAINQGDILLSAAAGHDLPRIAVIRMLLTFAVPFVVSLTSAALAQGQRARSLQDAPVTSPR